MKRISLYMVRDTMNHLPTFSCPPGFQVRTYLPGDEKRWATIETLAGEFPNAQQALTRFSKDYGSSTSELATRCFFFENPDGNAIGTATAWYGHFAGDERGQVAWVGIIPAYQGRKLAKPLLSMVMKRIAQDHEQAYLSTQTTSYQAVNLYLNFGFVPSLVRESCQEGWLLMEHILKRQILSVST